MSLQLMPVKKKLSAIDSSGLWSIMQQMKHSDNVIILK